MQQYIVTGMSCAACSARVEKAVNAVPGVTSCSVSLLTNSMGVEGNAAEDTIIEAVQNAGYGAKIRVQECNPGMRRIREHSKRNLSITPRRFCESACCGRSAFC